MSDERTELVALNEGVRPLIPMSIDDVQQFAEWVIEAGMVPSSYEVKEGTTEERHKKTKAKLMLGVMAGLEVGFGPMTALSTIAIINNRRCIWGDGAVALAQRGRAVEWEKSWYEGDPGSDDWTAFYSVKRRNTEEPITRTFAVKDARRAHLWNNPKKAPWIEYPKRMLFNRARAWALRDGFADYLMGLSIAEEIQDLPTEPKAVNQTRLNELLGPPLGAASAVDSPQPGPVEDAGQAESEAPAAQGDLL